MVKSLSDINTYFPYSNLAVRPNVDYSRKYHHHRNPFGRCPQIQHWIGSDLVLDLMSLSQNRTAETLPECNLIEILWDFECLVYSL